jgi:hypothetical protein
MEIYKDTHHLSESEGSFQNDDEFIEKSISGILDMEDLMKNKNILGN